MITASPIIESAPNQHQTMLDNYASIVEKTNNQLGLGVNLLSLAVTILSIIIAVIAIFVAWAIWKNSKEQKELTKQFFSEQEKMIKEKKKNYEKLESKFENLISEYENKLKVADGENKKQLQRSIDELKKEKVSAGAYIGLDSAGMFSAVRTDNLAPLTIAGYEKTMICSKCSRMFKFSDNDNGVFSVVFNPSASGKKTVYCSYCGAANTP